ncbi:hypothetical protein D0C36_17185 [Mucilaginibacter conchicola]|uniref:Uncharacterized protein n=1 Tax=Mucilaginibacter conchicola TaxID=2303333 RepID=A0A372NP27_9SPHI|nr:hypothetical protein D0C36_17185 [Mucilaginibacter conchicola]
MCCFTVDYTPVSAFNPCISQFAGLFGEIALCVIPKSVVIAVLSLGIRLAITGKNAINMIQTEQRAFNTCLTRRVISLHKIGYTEDFRLVERQNIQCLQTSECFAINTVNIRLIDCVLDCSTYTYKYIHTIDTDTNCRGLLIINGILPLNNCMSLPA